MNATLPITLDDMQVARAAYPTTVQGHGESDHIRRELDIVLYYVCPPDGQLEWGIRRRRKV
jgi:hypothetical protein